MCVSVMMDVAMLKHVEMTLAGTWYVISVMNLYERMHLRSFLESKRNPYSYCGLLHNKETKSSLFFLRVSFSVVPPIVFPISGLTFYRTRAEASFVCIVCLYMCWNACVCVCVCLISRRL